MSGAYTSLLTLSIAITLFAPLVFIRADTEDHAVYYNNDNITTVSHPAIDTFSVSEDTSTTGTTTNGITFTQININNDTTRLHKFQIQEAWWYICERGIIGYGDGLSEIQALSIYLTLPNATG